MLALLLQQHLHQVEVVAVGRLLAIQAGPGLAQEQVVLGAMLGLAGD